MRWCKNLYKWKFKAQTQRNFFAVAKNNICGHGFIGHNGKVESPHISVAIITTEKALV